MIRLIPPGRAEWKVIIIQLIVLAFIFLAACALPVIVDQNPQLTAPVSLIPKIEGEQHCGEAARLAIERLAELKQCNCQLTAIRDDGVCLD